MFFHFKKCRNSNLKIGVYLFATTYLLIISNLLEYLWVGPRIITHILLASPKHMSILKFHLMTKIWKQLDKILSGKITCLTVNVVESVYYNSSLPFRIISVKYLQESICFELRIGGKCCKFSCLYRSPSQTQDEFEIFLKTLNRLQIKFMKTTHL